VRLLLDAGAQIEAKNNDDDTALFLSSQYGLLGVVRLLIDLGAVVDARNNSGWTSLMLACASDHAVVVHELLARGADVNARSNDGRTALHVASNNGCAEAMRELLKRRDVDTNAQDDGGHTPLMCTSDLMATTILIAAGANLALLDNAGHSALFWAEFSVQQDMAAGGASVTPAERKKHKGIVALIKAHLA